MLNCAISSAPRNNAPPPSSPQTLRRSLNPPPELISLPQGSTVADLRAAATAAFADIYIIMAGFSAESMEGLASTSDKARVQARSSEHSARRPVEVRGRGADLTSEFRFEGGFEQWVVQCRCGTVDDDGERMVRDGYGCTPRTPHGSVNGLNGLGLDSQVTIRLGVV